MSRFLFRLFHLIIIFIFIYVNNAFLFSFYLFRLGLLFHLSRKLVYIIRVAFRILKQFDLPPKLIFTQVEPILNSLLNLNINYFFKNKNPHQF